jgi:glycosyltransferase involved in cell wall biosynthesis
MSNSPFFTVIVPVYNRADLVGETIESVLSQKYADFELILVDDGSLDDSVVKMQEYQDKDGRVILHRLEKNLGRCAARNKGLELAKGEWICYLDSDDTYYSNHLQLLHELIQGNPKHLAFATDQHINGNLKRYKSSRIHKENIELTLNDFIENNPLTANQVCHRKDLAVKWSHKRISISEDWLFMRELALKCKIKKRARVTNNLRDHDNRSMNTTDPFKFVQYNLLAADEFLKNNDVPKSYRNRIQTYTHLLCANVFLSAGDKKNGWVQFRLSLKHPIALTYALFYKAIIKFILP